MIIGLHGKAGHGKDTAAAGLQNFYQLSFAKPIKDASKILYNLTDEQLHGKLKEVPDKRWNISPREIMQQLGDLCRSSNPNFFIVLMRTRIEKALEQGIRNIVITDVRYANEAKLIKDMGGRIIKINRNVTTTQHTSHSSEKGIDDSNYIDFTIDNNGTIEQLIEKVKKIASYGSNN